MRMMAIRTGAMNLIMIVQAFSSLNALDSLISRARMFSLTSQPNMIQVKISTIGMMTELEMKSKKSSSEEPSPSGCMPESTL